MRLFKPRPFLFPLIIIGTILFLIGSILPCAGAEDLPSSAENQSSIEGNSSLLMADNQTSGYDDVLNETIPEKMSVSPMKSPKSKVIFAEPPNTTSSQDTREISPATPDETNRTEGVNNTTSADQYDSLGDIIKAKDWKALGEYNCKIKAENADRYDDSVVAFGALKSNWDSYFTSPPEIIYYPCCG